jgi:Fe-S-cluster containining protein
MPVLSAELPIIPERLCHHCGACCRHMVQPPFILDEIDRLPLELKVEIENFRDYVRSGVPDEFPCIWLDLGTMRCKHHEHRPDICRDYEMGGEDCRWQRAQSNIG